MKLGITARPYHGRAARRLIVARAGASAAVAQAAEREPRSLQNAFMHAVTLDERCLTLGLFCDI